MRNLVFGALIFAAAGSAGTVSYVNTSFDLGGSWRDPSLTKLLDIDGDNVLGTDGWYVLGDSGSSSIPSYIANVSANSSTYPGNALYYIIDDPLTTPGANPSQIISGTFNPNAGQDNPATLFSFQLADPVPGTIRIGLMVDNLDGTEFNSDAMELLQTNGTADVKIDTTGATYNDQVPDWIFFDLTGSAGDAFSIVAYGSPAGPATLGAISFDSIPTPEPAGISLVLAGLAGVAISKRRRK